MTKNLYNLIGREPEKVEGLKISFGKIKGTLTLIPKNEYVKNKLTKMDYGIYIHTQDGMDVPIDWLGSAVSPARFNDYYKMNENGEITKR